MDTTAVFQLMLDKAVQAHPGDFANFVRTSNVQDQLQEMVDEEYWEIRRYPVGGRLKEEEPFEMSIPGKDYTVEACSMEQLLLAVVMSEKYQKRWGGQDWVARA